MRETSDIVASTSRRRSTRSPKTTLRSITEQQDESPKVKRRKTGVNLVYNKLKSLGPDDQFELWKKVLFTNPFNLHQLQFLHNYIGDRIRLDIISAVPFEIALYIMSFLSPQDLCNAAQVCRSWRIVCEDNRLWREKCHEERLLDDKLTLDIIFRKRIKKRHEVQENFARDFNSAAPNYKTAYMRHINILRNWRTRNLEIPEPLVWQQTQQLQQQIQQHMQQHQQQQQAPHPQQVPIPAHQLTPSAQLQHEQQHQNNHRQQQPNTFQGCHMNQTSAKQNYKMRLRCHDDSVITCLQYNARSGLIVSGSDDQTLRVWSSETGQCVATLEGHTGGVWSSQLTEDDIVISGATDRTIRIWRALTGDLLHILYGHTSTVRCLAVDKDSVVSGSRDSSLRLWNIKSGDCQHVFLGHNAAVRCVEFRDGIIVSGAYDHMVMVWDATTGNCIHTLNHHSGRIYSLQFDGKTIASGSLDTTICVWDAETGKLRHSLLGHHSLTSKMLLRGNLLVSANADSYCKIWDVESGACLRTLGEDDADNKHTSAITSVYFDNRHVVTSSDDGTVKLWDARTGTCVRNLVTLPTAANGGVIWRIRASYTKLICAVGSRTQTEDTHLLVLDFDDD